MNGEQLWTLLTNYDCLKKTFIHITSIDNLPDLVKSQYPQLFIINPGRHWICVIFHSSSKAEYFDSLGKPPEFYGSSLSKFIDNNSRTCIYLQRQLQSNTSNICGLYVAFFVLMRICFQISLKKMYEIYKGNLYQNDQFIKLYFTHIYVY